MDDLTATHGALRRSLEIFLRHRVAVTLAVFVLGLGIGINSGLTGVRERLASVSGHGLIEAGFEGAGVGECGVQVYTVQRQMAVSLGGEPELVRGYWVNSEFFDVIQVEAHRGRLLTRADELPGARPVAVVSYDLWERISSRKLTSAGADDPALGSLSVDGRQVEVVGVLPPDYISDVDIWLPATQNPLYRQGRPQHLL